MQSVHMSNIDYDEKVGSDIAEKWLQVQRQLPAITDLRIKRCVNFDEHSEIIIFADGSTKGYGSVASVRDLSESSQTYRY